jgi:hypothetical protein
VGPLILLVGLASWETVRYLSLLLCAMDPASAKDWPPLPKRPNPFNSAQKDWLDARRDQFLAEKPQGGAALKTLAHTLATEMEELWPVVPTVNDIAGLKDEAHAKRWARSARGDVRLLRSLLPLLLSAIPTVDILVLHE